MNGTSSISTLATLTSSLLTSGSVSSTTAAPPDFTSNMPSPSTISANTLASSVVSSTTSSSDSSQTDTVPSEVSSLTASPATTSPSVVFSTPASSTTSSPEPSRISTTLSSIAGSPSSGSNSSVNPTYQTQSSKTQSLSAGAVAGIVIGCAISVSLFTIAAMLLLQRKSARANPRHGKNRSSKSSGSIEPKQEGKAHPTGTAHVCPRFGIETFLTQQADDGTIRQRVLIVFDQVEGHVDNFYKDISVDLTSQEEAEMSRFQTPLLSKPLAALLETSKRKTTLIKHCLAFYVVALVKPTKLSRMLLPCELSTTLIATKPCDSAAAGTEDHNHSLAMSRWRMLTAYLRPDLFDMAQYRTQEEDERLHMYAMSFCQAFAPFGMPEHDEEKLLHLKEVLRRAVKIALWLLTQPSAFDFDWTPRADVGENAGNAVVTVPALWKTHDEDGMKLEQPQVLQKATTRMP